MAATPVKIIYKFLGPRKDYFMFFLCSQIEIREKISYMVSWKDEEQHAM